MLSAGDTTTIGLAISATTKWTPINEGRVVGADPTQWQCLKILGTKSAAESGCITRPGGWQGLSWDKLCSVDCPCCRQKPCAPICVVSAPQSADEGVSTLLIVMLVLAALALPMALVPCCVYWRRRKKRLTATRDSGTKSDDAWRDPFDKPPDVDARDPRNWKGPKETGSNPSSEGTPNQAEANPGGQRKEAASGSHWSRDKGNAAPPREPFGAAFGSAGQKQDPPHASHSESEPPPNSSSGASREPRVSPSKAPSATEAKADSGVTITVNEHVRKVDAELDATRTKDIEFRRKTFKALLIKWHPDKNAGGMGEAESAAQANEVFKRLMERRDRYLAT